MKKLLIILIALYSCTSTREFPIDANCTDERIEGNLDINTPNDDIIPYLHHGRLHFVTKVTDTSLTYEYNSVRFANEITGDVGEIIDFEEVEKLNFINLIDIGNPSYFYDKSSDKTEIYFSAAKADDIKKNIDIYYSFKFSDDKWSNPIGIDTDINTPSYESNPFISDNGNILLFVSDRIGGYGGLDIYISYRNLDGSWQVPENLGIDINTEYDEKFPSLGHYYNLFFSSNGYSDGDNFDIIKCEKDGGTWKDGQLMLYPINSQYDEIGQAVNKKSIFLASNRPGGCGKFDIYNFDLCGPVHVVGEIVYENIPVSLSGIVNLRNEEGDLINQATINEIGQFSFNLVPNNYYSIDYKNDCITNFEANFDFFAPCSDTSTVVFNSKFIIPDQPMNFSYEDYKLPFFVTGYYVPNTKENLSKLRRQFQYNILGHSDTTRYIQYPDSTYDQQAIEIDKILSETKKFLLSNAKDLANLCFETETKIYVNITGYADPRPMSKKSSYIGPNIKEKKYNLNIKNGRPIDNLLLSKLRAYFTAKELELFLMQDENYKEIKDYIVWNIEGKGVDDNEDLINADKRRVDISINISEKQPAN